MSKLVITTLGTVSPYLKDNMNCPGFLIEYNGEKILLDCGNGITRLLDIPNSLDKLHVIITHYHKDHLGDLGIIQYASYVYHNLGLLKDKIKIYLPKNDFQSNKKTIVDNSESFAEYFDIYDGLDLSIQDLNISFHDNRSHTIESFLVKLQSADFNVVYTSDIGTTNLDDLISFCWCADLIICESSFLQKHNSNSNTHFKAYDAGYLASLANAKKLLLTHFWPDEKKQEYLEEAKQVFKNVCVAEEGKKLILRR